MLASSKFMLLFHLCASCCVLLSYHVVPALAQSNSSSVPDAPPPPDFGSQANSSSVPISTRRGEPTSGPWVVVVILVIVIFVVVMIWFGLAYYKHAHRGNSVDKEARDFAKRFEYHQLSAATDKFSRELGRGAFGVVYKGKLNDQDEVAVKKLKRRAGETKDFFAELKTISETRHKNLVRLKGWSSRNRGNLINFMCWWRQTHSVELFLVYELVRYGSLDVHLSEKTERVLSWAIRYNIVKDIGSALRYLHHEHECKGCILHRDIKPGNILLDENFNAKLSDFGLSRIANHKNEAGPTTAIEISDSRTTSVLTRAVGTKAYMDPNCMKDGMVSFKRHHDVYSFGLVLLEIACTGKRREYVWEMYIRNPENMAAVADARLTGNFDVAQMQRVVVLGLWCSSLNERQRPSLLQAMEVLEHGAPLPDLREC